jgi:general stress protein 26
MPTPEEAPFMPTAQAAPRKAEKADKLWRMVQDIKIAMLTTRDGEVLRSRPMECVQAEPSGTLWFFTGATSPKTGEVDGEHEVALAFIDKAAQNYVSISGRATVVRDRAKARALWTEEQRVWYPDGLDDPELALLRVNVEQAEYWDRPTNAMVAAQGLVRAIADESPDLGENEKLSFERSS